MELTSRTDKTQTATLATIKLTQVYTCQIPCFLHLNNTLQQSYE